MEDEVDVGDQENFSARDQTVQRWVDKGEWFASLT
jgi:hypothetical protein